MKGHEMRAQETGWAQNRLLCFVSRAGGVSYVRDYGILSPHFSLIHVGLLLTWTG